MGEISWGKVGVVEPPVDDGVELPFDEVLEGVGEDGACAMR
jgi:hypothetical protein